MIVCCTNRNSIEFRNLSLAVSRQVHAFKICISVWSRLVELVCMQSKNKVYWIFRTAKSSTLYMNVSAHGGERFKTAEELCLY